MINSDTQVHHTGCVTMYAYLSIISRSSRLAFLSICPHSVFLPNACTSLDRSNGLGFVDPVGRGTLSRALETLPDFCIDEETTNNQIDRRNGLRSQRLSNAGPEETKGRLEIRNPKHEALNKFKIPMLECSKRNYSMILVCCLDHLDFGNSNLFRISIFGFSILDISSR